MRFKDKLINAVYRIEVDEVKALPDDYQFSEVAQDVGLLSSQFPYVKMYKLMSLLSN